MTAGAGSAAVLRAILAAGGSLSDGLASLGASRPIVATGASTTQGIANVLRTEPATIPAIQLLGSDQAAIQLTGSDGAGNHSGS
jgi:hypothetical protein